MLGRLDLLLLVCRLLLWWWWVKLGLRLQLLQLLRRAVGQLLLLLLGVGIRSSCLRLSCRRHGNGMWASMVTPPRWGQFMCL